MDQKPHYYRSEIDGLRFLAVLPVILFHAGFDWFKGGYVGVDVFFVISGYLITSIIFKEKEEGNFSFLSFYERRARRILPALFFIMLVNLVCAYNWLTPDDLSDFGKSLLAVSIFSANIHFWLESGYFAAAAELKPMLHTWSLAVEEQFYLVYPFFLFLFWKIGQPRLFLVILLISISSLMLAEWGAHNANSANFYLLPSRIWELMIGAICVYIWNNMPISKHFAELGSYIGLSLILYSIITFDDLTPFPSSYGLIPTLGTALFIVCVKADTTVGKIFSFKPFVVLGMASYSAYLWHHPIFAFAKLKYFLEEGSAEFIWLSIICLFLALLTWKFIETPFRDRASFSQKKIFIFSILGIVFFICVGLVLIYSDGFVKKYTRGLTDDQKIIYRQIVGFKKETYKSIFDNQDCKFWSMTADAEFINRFDSCVDKYGKALIIHGDSHAIDIYNAFYLNFNTNFVVGISRGGCRPHTPRNYCKYKEFTQFIQSRKNSIKAIYFHQAGFYLFTNGRVNGSRGLFKKSVKIYNINFDYVNLIYDYLSNIGDHSKVIWLGPYIEPYINQKRLLNKPNFHELRLRPNLEVNFKSLDKKLSTFIKNKSNKQVSYFSLIKAIDFDVSKDYINSETLELNFSDSDHFSAKGERIFGKRIIRKLKNFSDEVKDKERLKSE